MGPAPAGSAVPGYERARFARGNGNCLIHMAMSGRLLPDAAASWPLPALVAPIRHPYVRVCNWRVGERGRSARRPRNSSEAAA